MAPEMQQVMKELEGIRKELVFIKEHMMDRDMFLNKEEKEILKESYKNEREGSTISSQDLKEELGI